MSIKTLGLFLSTVFSMALLFALLVADDTARAQAQTAPTPEPADECVSALDGDGAVNGSWSSDCDSEARDDSYASYYTFTLAESADVTITAESGVDTYLFLREGSGRDGTVAAENDDHADESDCAAALRSDTDSCITESLDEGSYTIEVTTYDEGEIGDFTLTVSGLPAAVVPTPEPSPEPTPTPDPTPELPTDPCVQPLPDNGVENGSWTSACTSENKSGSYALYYTFTLSEASEVTITLESSVDTVLYLLSGTGREGGQEAENDDHADESDCAAVLGSDTDSCITESLDEGSYTIEATTYDAGTVGDFTLTISGLPGAATPTPEPTPEPPPDRAALVALYNATDGANWTDKENWLSDEPLGDWQGVTTDDEGRVIELHLWGNNLVGEIPTELGGLSELTRLELQNNQLTGNIPSELGSLYNLTILDIDTNQLNGGIPSAFGNLSNLQKLDFSSNELSGAIPAQLASLSNLTILNFHTNQLTGQIPSALGSLSNLVELKLYENRLSGEIPTELGSLANLEELSLGDNELDGDIPSDLGNLASLAELYLDDNKLSGRYPLSLVDCPA